MTLVLKRCRKCGLESRVSPPTRRCRRQNFGPRSFWCYGELDAVPRPAKADPDAVPVPAGKGVGWVLGEEAEAARCELFRERARKAAAQAQARAEQARLDIERAVRRQKEWQARLRRAQRQAEMSDADIAVLREHGRKGAAARNAPKVRRAITVG